VVKQIHLGVNIDHIATLRQARLESYPDPLEAALLCEQAGADSIVAHLREDRRHIQDSDVVRLKKKLTKRFNLEMSLAPEIVSLALRLKPDQVTLVPERRQELTTEGGLDVVKAKAQLNKIIPQFHKKKIKVSLFIAPVLRDINVSASLGVDAVEIHTGTYALAKTKTKATIELNKIKKASAYAATLGLDVYAGHGLTYHNVKSIAAIPEMQELNIGHAMIGYAAFYGLKKAVQDMKRLMKEECR